MPDSRLRLPILLDGHPAVSRRSKRARRRAHAARVGHPRGRGSNDTFEYAGNPEEIFARLCARFLKPEPAPNQQSLTREMMKDRQR